MNLFKLFALKRSHTTTARQGGSARGLQAGRIRARMAGGQGGSARGWLAGASGGGILIFFGEVGGYLGGFGFPYEGFQFCLVCLTQTFETFEMAHKFGACSRAYPLYGIQLTIRL